MCKSHFFKQLFKITILACISLWLTGCTGLMAEQVQLAKNCKSSNVLITNLAKTEASRETQLPDGNQCPHENRL